jgi:hypothetical protein
LHEGLSRGDFQFKPRHKGEGLERLLGSEGRSWWDLIGWYEGYLRGAEFIGVIPDLGASQRRAGKNNEQKENERTRQ